MNEEYGESELSTLEYWKTHYRREVENYKSHGNVGDIWFGEDIVDRIVNWMNHFSRIKKTHSVLDVGCGNGMFLITLHKEGYTNLSGIDYCEAAIVLAKEVANQFNSTIEYKVFNILEDDFQGKTYDIILDKGTYDAISLSANAKYDKVTYGRRVSDLLQTRGLFILTSCNWTQEELLMQFNDNFTVLDVIPTPQFQFGGKLGSVVTSVVLERK